MNISNWFKKNKWYLALLPLLFLFDFIYFLPFFQGKDLDQFDAKQWRGSAQEIIEYREKTGENNFLWTNSMFCGIPSYQVTSPEGGNLIKKIFRGGIFDTMPLQVHILLLALICFYIMCWIIGISPWISLICAFGFAFSTYNIGALEAGQTTKIGVVATFPLTISGLILLFRRQYWSAFLLLAFGLAMSFSYNHLQMAYYLLMAVMVWFIVELVYAIRRGEIGIWVKQGFIFAIAAGIAALTDITNMWTTAEYSTDSIRGPAILKSNDQSTGGLDKDYALAWSSGKLESFSFLIPNIVGGSSFYRLDEDAASVKDLIKKGVPKNQLEKMPTYWGEMPATGCPYYSGIIIAFLFLMASILVRGPIKWAWLAIAILSILLSWGKHLDWFTSLFFHYFPAYNKFRAVSTIQVLLMTMLPLGAAIGLQKILENNSKEEIKKALKISTISMGSILLIFLVLGKGILPFTGASDTELDAYGYDVAKLIEDRKSLFTTDAIRSFVLFLIGVGAVYYYTQNRLMPKYF